MSAAAPCRTRAAPPAARDLLAWLTLALATLAILWPLGLTHRVLAGVDALTYFTPYWAYRMAELRAGQMPLWNPYLFLGVPFLANPQAAVLYPLHWPLSWLRPEQALIWSALLHVWLAAGFTYTFARRSLGRSRLAAWLAGLIFGLGGFTLARVENINQLNALAWLPALLWLYDETARAASGRSRIRWGVALAVAIALQLLAGHTQTTFVNMVGLGLWAVWPCLMILSRRGKGDAGTRRHGEPGTNDERSARLRNYLLPLLAVIPAILLAAAQLLPTLELNGLGLRTGGLPYRQAVSFSLRPRLLAQSLLPPFGRGLDAAFGSEGYAEFVGYVGIAALVLAGIGLSLLWRRNAEVKRPPWNVQRATLLAGVGIPTRPRRVQPGLLSAVARDPRLRPVPCAGTLAGAVCAGGGGTGCVRAGCAWTWGNKETRKQGNKGTRRHSDTGTRGRGDTATWGQGGRASAGLGQTYGNRAGGPAARRADYHPAAPAIG